MEAVVKDKNVNLQNNKRLTREEVADLFAEDIGVWSITKKTINGEASEANEVIMEINWSVVGKTIVGKFSPIINGKIVPFIGYKEYDADEGVFLWKAKGEGFPETISREVYDQTTKIYNGVCFLPDGAKETTEVEILGKNKRLFKSQVNMNGIIVYSQESVFTRLKTAEELKAEGK